MLIAAKLNTLLKSNIVLSGVLFILQWNRHRLHWP